MKLLLQLVIIIIIVYTINIIIGADNMSYVTHSHITHVVDQTVKTTEWLNTINEWQRFNPPNRFPNFHRTDHLFRSIRPENIMEKLETLRITQAQFLNLLQTASNHSLNLRDNGSHFAYPTNDQNVEIAQILFQEPLFHLVTSKYIDMELYLNHVYLKYLGLLLISLVNYLFHLQPMISIML